MATEHEYVPTSAQQLAAFREWMNLQRSYEVRIGGGLPTPMMLRCNTGLALLDSLLRARAAAQVLKERVTALGLAADDRDPLVMETAGPVGEAEADLFAALGLFERAPDGAVTTKAPVESIEQLRAERDNARVLAEVRRHEIEALRTEIAAVHDHPFSDVIEKETAEQIATWLDALIAHECDGVGLGTLAAQVRAGAWRTK